MLRKCVWIIACENMCGGAETVASFWGLVLLRDTCALWWFTVMELYVIYWPRFLNFVKGIWEIINCRIIGKALHRKMMKAIEMLLMSVVVCSFFFFLHCVLQSFGKWLCKGTAIASLDASWAVNVNKTWMLYFGIFHQCPHEAAFNNGCRVTSALLRDAQMYSMLGLHTLKIKG